MIEGTLPFTNADRKSEDQSQKRPRNNQQRKINRQENTNRKSRYETSHTVHPPSRKWLGYARRENRTATSTLRSSYCGGRVNPRVKPSDASFGVRTNRFGFTITGASNLVIVVEASTNLANPAWIPVGTSTLTDGSSYFSDPQWTNQPARFYRLRSP